MERGGSADLGGRVDFAPSRDVRWSCELVGFGRLPNDLIAFKRSAAGVLRPYNVAEARVLGLEGEAAVELFEGLRLAASSTVLDARDTTPSSTLANDRLPLLAPITIAPEAELTVRDLVPELRLDRASIGTRLLYRAPRSADPAGLIELPAQLLLDIDASLSFARESLVVRGRLSNLLGDVTTDQIGYPLPGRAGYVSVEAWWR
jgi:iron complex outermembrane receptor protein